MDSSFASNAAGPRSPCYEPDVSVIVPAYNAEDTIEECVSSLLALRYPRTGGVCARQAGAPPGEAPRGR